MSLFRKIVFGFCILSALIFQACVRRADTRPESPSPPPTTYDINNAYNNENPSISLSNVKTIALLMPEDITDNPPIIERLYKKIKARLNFLGYNVVPYREISKMAETNGIKPGKMFYPPYLKKMVNRFGVSALMVSSLIDYQCEEFSEEQPTETKGQKNYKRLLCSFTFIMRIHELGERDRAFWVGTTAFRNTVKNIAPVFDEKIDVLLGNIPKYGKKAPKHPMDLYKRPSR